MQTEPLPCVHFGGWLSVGLSCAHFGGSLSVGLSSGALATALTGFGIVASPALAGVATVCGLASVGFAATRKRLERKEAKHEKIYTLALAKRNSVNELVSKALEDKIISDVEFRIIAREVEKIPRTQGHNQGWCDKDNKRCCHTNPSARPRETQKRTSQRSQTKVSKKDKSSHRSVQVRFERLNSGFNLYISKYKSIEHS